ncbi:PEP motif putative anchor domain protein [Stanieria cyanosphaera PCC 7437]|uniref:PEP motif putative anchor domain protein n=1 Tax=Stanieria cyanosphaera (strain ATCC 29371 / PCC 7437) TaxID=111780 RepID=K9XX64_STAC7|nr:hypothetical protein [Stanieria cyanosphaera]AFZ37108.1 PEP motif putative anchor domain protein [Stanieria cyanosphaera PCC 7437]
MTLTISNKVLGLAAVATASIVSFAGSAEAAVIQFDDKTVHGGTISYNGTGGSLVGKDLLLDTVLGIDTVLNNKKELSCVGCKLNFVTGANISETPLYEFASGGSVTITGKILDGLTEIVNGTLLTGTFTENIFGNVANGFAVFTGIGVNSVNSALSSYYGVNATDFTFAQTSIAAKNVKVEKNRGFTGTVTNTDFDTKPVQTTPEPTATLGLLAVGAFAANSAAKRKKQA